LNGKHVVINPDTAASALPDQPIWLLVVARVFSEGLILFRLLERLGHHATVADDVPGALELLAGGDYDLVVLDGALHSSGPKPIQSLRRAARRQGLPIVVFGSADRRDGVRKRSEVDDEVHLTAPLDMAGVEAAIERATARRVRTRPSS
jgi:adenylate cyclase